MGSEERGNIKTRGSAVLSEKIEKKGSYYEKD
jgi:hypothetical protein